MGESYLELDFPTIIVFVSVITTLTIQLILCFKVKRIFIKLLPIALLIVSTIVFFICCTSVNGWDALGYLFFALLSFGLIFVCGIGWGIWAVAKRRNR